MRLSLALLLSVLLLADLLLTLASATACNAHSSECAGDERVSLVPYAFERVFRSWEQSGFLFGEQTLDVMILCVLRVLVHASLPLLCRARAVPMATEPLVQPLQPHAHTNMHAAVNGHARVQRSGDTTTHTAADTAADSAASANGTARGRMSTSRAEWLSSAVVLLTLLLSGVKALARMLQSGLEGPGSGSLAATGTAPPEPGFWLAICVPVAAAAAEMATCAALCRQVSPAVNSADLAKSRRAAAAPSDEEKDPTASLKLAYLERTSRRVPTIQYVSRMLRADWAHLLLAYTALVVAAAGESSVPLLYGRVIDAIAIHHDTDEFLKWMGSLLLVSLVTGIFTGLRGSTFILIGGRFGVRLRQRLFDSLLAQEADFFSAVSVGDVTSRLSADCEKVSDQVQLNVNVFLRSAIQVLFTLGFMLFLSPKLAASCFVVVPAIVVVSKLFGDFMRVLTQDAQSALAKANSTASEVVSSITTVKAFAAESEDSRRYARGVGDFLHCQWRVARAYFFYSSLTFTFLPYATYCIVLYYGAQLTRTPRGCAEHSDLHCEIDASGLVSFVFYMQSLFAAFTSLGQIYTGLAQAVGAADKVVSWIERTPVMRTSTMSPLAPSSCRGDIKMDKVVFRYALRPERVVLNSLSMHARPGEVVALCGPSGGGKSSCIALLEGLYAPESGAVLLDDIPVTSLPPKWFHRQVALVGQEPVLFARSIEENICYGLDDERPTKDEVQRAAELANAHDFISGFELGYETFVGERGAQLSGGQKQRVAIARALVRRPAVLLLDEATSALDADSESVVQAAIDTMIAQGCMTVLVIAHRLSTIRNANRILVISNGAVAEQGTHDELIAAHGEYAKLVAKQMQVHHGSSASLSSQDVPDRSGSK